MVGHPAASACGQAMREHLRPVKLPFFSPPSTSLHAAAPASRSFLPASDKGQPQIPIVGGGIAATVAVSDVSCCSSQLMQASPGFPARAPFALLQCLQSLRPAALLTFCASPVDSQHHQAGPADTHSPAATMGAVLAGCAASCMRLGHLATILSRNTAVG